MHNKINKFIEAKADGTTGEICIYGEITDSKWFDEDVTPKEISDSLNNMGKIKNLDIRICSYGGSVFAGNAIYDIIMSYKNKNNVTVNVFIDGIAASMATGIAMVGDNVYIAENGTFMIHDPVANICGNTNDFKKGIKLLEHVKDTLVSNYMKRFNADESVLRDLMAKETWLNADEAKEYGFVDEITKGVNIVASAKGITIDGTEFGKNVASLMIQKNPNIKKEKEESGLEYDSKLKDFGVDKETFDSISVDSEKVLRIAEIVKDKFDKEPKEEFVSKDYVCKALDCDDITADKLIDFAKSGKNSVTDEKTDKKVRAYDKIVKDAREEALKNAVRAQGTDYNEEITRKTLNALENYSDIMELSALWSKQAEKLLNAGNRVSTQDSGYRQADSGNYVKEINPNDCKF